MICPSCKTHIPDGSVRCPACHASVAMTVAMPALQGRWCPACGAGVDWGDEVCPHCGLPLESSWGSPRVDEGPAEPQVVPKDEVDRGEADSTDGTREIARIESAIPPEDDPTSKVMIHDEMPRVGRLLLAAVFSAAMVGGLALVITHPWNPNQYSIKATTEKDTSMAGFPGTVESLTGQDGNDAPQGEVLSGDDATLAELVSIHKRLGSYARRANKSEKSFGKVGISGTQDERDKGKREIDVLAIDVSNAITALDQVDVTSGTYAEDRENLKTLGNWLRNRVETLQEAWRVAAESADPEAEREQLEELVAADHDASGKSAYRQLFEKNYEDWLPQSK